MKHLSKIALIAFLSISILACKKSSDSTPEGPKGTATLSGDIKGVRNLSADTIYVISGFTYVTSGATLNVPAGTILKGQNSTKGTLVIEAGGVINAIGTKEKPIVFTSERAAGARAYGDWGGLVLIGKAPTNQAASTTFEGGIRGTYGAFNTPTDNSGTLKYVRIEFAGVALTTVANSEINGLTMYGVGSGTTIDYVQVSYSGDDSYEWFGGNVNLKHLIALRGWDDDWDTDHGWQGKVQYGVSLRDPNFADQSSSNGYESDNYNPGTGTVGANDLLLTAGVFSNMANIVFAGTPVATTVSGSGPYQAAMHLRRNTSISIFNSFLIGYPQGFRFDGTTTKANADAGNLQLRGITFANITTNYADAGGITAGSAQTFFETASNGNSTAGTISGLVPNLLSGSSFNLTSPNFLPTTNIGTAKFDGKGADAFFDKVTYTGPFSTTDNWTSGWANFDPQNTSYEVVK